MLVANRVIPLYIEENYPEIKVPEIIRATQPNHFATAKTLFLEYAESLGFSLCFQGFDQELATIDSIYAPPDGALLLAYEAQREFIGTVGIKRFGDNICEMKRLYVKPAFRKTGLGDTLVRASLECAKEFGYQQIYLDTIRETMKPAISLYLRHGFVEIPPYYPNPMPGVLYMGKTLTIESCSH